MISLEINKQAKLSEHFVLGELVKTKYVTEDGNIPSRVVIENLKRLCSWLEELRFRYNERYVLAHVATREGQTLCNSVASLPAHSRVSPCVSQEEPIVINSGYRSPEVNRLAGGAQNSNHLTGCAVDIRTYGIEQAMRYAVILMDYADDSNLDFDEILIEKNSKGSIWLHFAVRPKDNRRRIEFLKA